MICGTAQVGRRRIGFPFAGDTLGQLVSVSTNGAFAESYTYDPLGRRVSTTDGSGTIRHVYDGDQCVADGDANGAPVRVYSWGAGIDDLLAITLINGAATNSYYAVKDRLGSVQALMNASGSVIESYTYDAWGVTVIKNAGGAVIAASAYGNRFMFHGGACSAVTGLYNFRARWYDPSTGRWLSKDPIGISGGLNMYAFCGDDPVNTSDAFGLCTTSQFNADRFMQYLKDDPILKWTLPLEFTGLLNLKSPGTMRQPGSSPWTSIDRQWPWLPGANKDIGPVVRKVGPLTKRAGLYGGIATYISVFSITYTMVAPIEYASFCLPVGTPQQVPDMNNISSFINK